MSGYRDIFAVLVLSSGLSSVPVRAQTGAASCCLPPHSPTPEQMALIEGEIPFDQEVYDSLPEDTQRITPYAPIHMDGPPAFPAAMSNDYVTVTQYVYQVEYQTNAAHAVVTEFRTVNVTNYVPRYPKLLYAQLKFTESLATTNAWEDLGAPMAFRLGDTTNGFYTVELSIE